MKKLIDYSKWTDVEDPNEDDILIDSEALTFLSKVFLFSIFHHFTKNALKFIIANSKPRESL